MLGTTSKFWNLQSQSQISYRHGTQLRSYSLLHTRTPFLYCLCRLESIIFKTEWIWTGHSPAFGKHQYCSRNYSPAFWSWSKSALCDSMPGARIFTLKSLRRESSLGSSNWLKSCDCISGRNVCKLLNFPVLLFSDARLIGIDDAGLRLHSLASRHALFGLRVRWEKAGLGKLDCSGVTGVNSNGVWDGSGSGLLRSGTGLSSH